MMEDTPHRIFGMMAGEYIKTVPAELPRDAVGLWQIVPVGANDFRLSGDRLVEYVKKNILELLGAGARPVRSNPETKKWELQRKYIGSDDEVAETIINEWLAAGDGIPRVAAISEFDNPANPRGLWFALPKFYQISR